VGRDENLKQELPEDIGELRLLYGMLRCEIRSRIMLCARPFFDVHTITQAGQDGAGGAWAVHVAGEEAAIARMQGEGRCSSFLLI